MKKKLAFFISSLFFSIAAHAGSFSGCSVVALITAGDQNVHAMLSCTTPFTNLPACAEAGAYVGFDGSSPAGKRYYSLLSLALAMNLKVEGTIDSTCSPYQGNVVLLLALRAIKQ